MKLHHYTTIENLVLILNSRKIRFSRLTTVDDTEESENFGQYNIAPFLYVSCWTINNIESIPLWKMYTGNMRVSDMESEKESEIDVDKLIQQSIEKAISTPTIKV